MQLASWLVLFEKEVLYIIIVQTICISGALEKASRKHMKEACSDASTGGIAAIDWSQVEGLERPTFHSVVLFIRSA